MKLSPVVSTTLLVLAAFGSQQVSGHGYLVQPLAKFISPNVDKTQFVSTIDSYKLFPDGTFNTDPTINVESFVENFNKSEYKSIKAMIEDKQEMVVDDATPTCGLSVPDQTSYGAVNDTVYWGRNDDLTLDVGFVHVGPCEVWCDDNRAQHDMNCQVTYTPASGKGAAPVPIDSSVCTNAKRLTFYWVAMQGSTWQVYINCVNINDATSSSTTGTTTSTSATATSNTTPTAMTASPDTEDPTTDAPEVVATTPPATTPAAALTPTTEESSSTSAKCSTRRRIRG